MSDVTLHIGTYNVDKVLFEKDDATHKVITSFTALKLARHIHQEGVTVYIDEGRVGPENSGSLEKTRDGKIKAWLHDKNNFIEGVISRRGVDKMSLTVMSVTPRTKG